MTCSCRCCLASQPCAHVLVLSPRDNSDASRLWARFVDSPPGFVNLKVAPKEHRAERRDDEPVEVIPCRCGSSHAVLAYIVKHLRNWRAPMPDCGDCRRAP